MLCYVTSCDTAVRQQLKANKALILKWHFRWKCLVHFSFVYFGGNFAPPWTVTPPPMSGGFTRLLVASRETYVFHHHYVLWHRLWHHHHVLWHPSIPSPHSPPSMWTPLPRSHLTPPFLHLWLVFLLLYLLWYYPVMKLKIWMHFPQVFEKPIQLPLMSDGEKYFQIGIWEMGTEALCRCVANFISRLFSILCLRKIWLG